MGEISQPPAFHNEVKAHGQQQKAACSPISSAGEMLAFIDPEPELWIQGYTIQPLPAPMCVPCSMK